ncbi:MAG: hypothetical protein HY658_01045 [Actinobacteria bacterium]|nr:hypothetical protein [Actinomycetota bacterium]
MDDRAAFEQYDDPASSKLQGEARGRKSKTPLSTHVPIRFRPELIELVKHFAEQDGRTVSSWIRHLVERAVRAREAAESRTLVRHQGQVTAFRVSRSLAPSSTTEVEEFVEGLDLVAQG